MNRILSRRLNISFAVLALSVLVPCAHAEVVELDNASLKRLVDQGVTVVDLRRADEWQQTGIIKGSHPITYFQDKEQKVYDTEAWLASLRKLAKPDQPLVLICRSGKRSRHVASLLEQKAGYTKVYNVSDGITRWIGENNPVTSYEQKI